MGSILKPSVTAAVVLLLVGFVNPQPAGVRPGSAAAQSGAPQRHAPPQLPKQTVELPGETTGGRTIPVKAGDSLQAAIDEAQPGDRITLEPGATYQGPFRLPRKDGDGWITITSAAESELPRRGQRVTPRHAAQMPRLVATGDLVIEAMPGAHHYRLVGLEIAPIDGTEVTSLVQLGDRETSIDAQPHHIVIERSYLHGDPATGARRGVAMNSRHTAVVDSHLSDFKQVGVDAQAIAGWNGAGPFLIENNYLEASGENVMFGGADPSVRNLVPSDIEVRRNHMAKPLRWKMDHPSYEGTEWSIKNLFELKNARRVLVEANVFDYNWRHAQNGFAILFTPRNQEGGAPWSVVEDVTFANNLVRHVGGGINILGRDDNHPSQQTRRIAIRNNVFLDVGEPWGNGRLFQLLDGTANISIEHNTAIQTGSVLFGGDHAPHTGFVFQHNVAPHNEHGIIGSGTEPGIQTLARYFPRSVVRGNVIIGGDAGQYPHGNRFAASLDEVGIAPLADGHLEAVAAPATRSGDGAVAGADVATLLRELEGVAPIAGRRTTAVADGLPASGAGVGTAVAAALFWGAIVLLVYVYAGYPLIAALRARTRRRPGRRAPIEPTVSIVVVAYNEADQIDARIQNLLALDYPRNRVEIVIGSDGSTDETVARARRYQSLGVRVYDCAERRGKPAMLNDLVPRATGEIVLFADARQRFHPGALRALVENFADPEVGAVSGQLVLASPDGAATGQGAAFYWRYETFIRASESQVDSTIGATGAIYAIRRALFEPIPRDTLLDDVLIPIGIVRRGYRVLFEPRAQAFDRASATARQEFARKARTIAGNFQLLSRERWLFDPRRNRLWFATVSHKALRLTIPLLHAAVLVSNISLAAVSPYQWLLAAQIAFYAAALCGAVQRNGSRRFIGFTVPYTLCLLCWSTMVGFYRYVADRQPVTWERPTVTAPPVAAEADRRAGIAA